MLTYKVEVCDRFFRGNSDGTEEWRGTGDEGGGTESAGSEGSAEFEEEECLNFEWVSQATGCGPVRCSDLSDALSRVGLQQRSVPMYMENRGDCSGKRKADCLEGRGVLSVGRTGKAISKKAKLNPGGASPDSSALFARWSDE